MYYIIGLKNCQVWLICLFPDDKRGTADSPWRLHRPNRGRKHGFSCASFFCPTDNPNGRKSSWVLSRRIYRGRSLRQICRRGELYISFVSSFSASSFPFQGASDILSPTHLAVNQKPPERGFLSLTIIYIYRVTEITGRVVVPLAGTSPLAETVIRPVVES